VPTIAATVSWVLIPPGPLLPGVRQFTDVTEFHAVVVQSLSKREKVGVGSSAAKLKPIIVTEVPPEDAELPLLWFVITGPSYVKPMTRVPTTAATVTIMLRSIDVPGESWQLTAESLVQTVVMHAVSPTVALGVASL